MTKSVYPADMVAHLWANRHATEVRTSAKNLFTENGVLFSYSRSFAIGAFMPENKNGVSLLLWNNEKTSNTTNKHRAKAYRALSWEQSRVVVQVPELDYDLTRDLSRLATLCIQAATKPLELVEKARQNATLHADNAERFFMSARAIYGYLNDKKSADKVPTMAGFDDVKARARDILKGLKVAEYLETATIAATSALNWFTRAQNQTNATDVCTSCVNSEKQTKTAIEFYKRAGVSVPRKVATVQKNASLLFKTRANEAQQIAHEQTREDIAYRMRLLIGKMYVQKRSVNSIAFELSKFKEKTHGLDTNPAQWAIVYGENTADVSAKVAALKRRADSIVNADYFKSQLVNLEKSIDNYKLNLGYAVPNPETLKSRVSMWKECPAFFKAKAQTVIESAEKVAREHAEKVARENAEKIQNWRDGARVSLPYDVATMARIVGDTVQTSKGASVPLEHAKRLVKIARRIAGEGGKHFDVDGPKVGHFTVQSIRADLSIVIGCHEFSAIEAEHAARIIENA